MKNILISLIAVCFSSSAFSQERAIRTPVQKVMQCQVQMIVGNQAEILKVVEVQKTEDPHGAVSTFKLAEFGGITGLIGLMIGDNAVISLFSDSLQVGSSSFGVVANGQIAHHQLLLPNEPGKGLNSIVVDCAYMD